MFGLFRKKDDAQAASKQPGAAGASGDAQASPLTQIQRAYWTHDPAEQQALLARYPDNLTWPELLRLHHLACMEMLHSREGQAQIGSDSLDGKLDAPDMPARRLAQELWQRLSLPPSPYVTRTGLVWQGREGPAQTGTPDLRGYWNNASLTHPGCVEIIRVDADQQPRELAFVPFADLLQLDFGPPRQFRVARLVYEDKREEFVGVPILYGLSWSSPLDIDRTGQMTRFCCYAQAGRRSLGIGLGQQDWSVETDGKTTLLGIGSVADIRTGLDWPHPQFDDRCRARNADPAAMRRQMGVE